MAVDRASRRSNPDVWRRRGCRLLMMDRGWTWWLHGATGTIHEKGARMLGERSDVVGGEAAAEGPTGWLTRQLDRLDTLVE